METYNENDIREAGLSYNYVQDNHSSSSKGVLRGLHYSDQAIRRQDLHLECIESSERGDIERRFGIYKRYYSLGCVTAKLQHKSEVMIYLSVLTRNLQKRLWLLFGTFSVFLCQSANLVACAVDTI